MEPALGGTFWEQGVNKDKSKPTRGTSGSSLVKFRQGAPTQELHCQVPEPIRWWELKAGLESQRWICRREGEQPS